MKLNPKSCQWLVWSHEHKAWWRPAHQGYCAMRCDAGRYSFEEAIDILMNANFGLNTYPHEALVPDIDCAEALGMPSCDKNTVEAPPLQVTDMTSSMKLLPPAPNLCQECARDHPKDQPHNQQSLFYQVKFNMEHGRSPTWIDAMAHCSDETKELWAKHLAELGVKV